MGLRRGFIPTIVVGIFALILAISLYLSKNRQAILYEKADIGPLDDVLNVILTEMSIREGFEAGLDILFSKALYYSLSSGGLNVSYPNSTIPIRMTPEYKTYYYVYKDENNNVYIYKPNISDIERNILFFMEIYNFEYLREWYPNLYISLLRYTAPIRLEMIKFIREGVLDWDFVEFYYKGPLIRRPAAIGTSEGYVFFYPLFTARVSYPLLEAIATSRLITEENTMQEFTQEVTNRMDLNDLYVPAIICEGNMYPKYDWMSYLFYLNSPYLKDLIGKNLTEIQNNLINNGCYDEYCGEIAYNCSKSNTCVDLCRNELKWEEVLKFMYYRAFKYGSQKLSKSMYICAYGVIKNKTAISDEALSDIGNSLNMEDFFNKLQFHNLLMNYSGEDMHFYEDYSTCSQECSTYVDENGVTYIVLPEGNCSRKTFQGLNLLLVPLDMDVEIKYSQVSMVGGG